MIKNLTTDLLLRRTCAMIIVIALVAAIYFARDVFLPLTLAIFLAFVLSSPVKWLERKGVRPAVAVGFVAFLLSASLFLGGSIISNQFISVVNDLPNYQKNIVSKIHSVQGWGGSGLRRFINMYDDLDSISKSGTAQEHPTNDPNSQNPSRPESQQGSTNKSITPSPDNPPGDLVGKTEEHPLAVTITNSSFQPWNLVREWAGPILSPISLIGLVALFTIFILLERDDLRNRLVVLLGSQRLYGTTQMLDETAGKVSRYLRTQFLLNTLYGVSITAGLAIVGLPNAILWGFLGFLFRFLPYIGPLLSMVLPIILSLAVFEGWQKPVCVIAMYAVIELITSNVLEPLMYGSSTGLSKMGILVSALFWTWLWGIPGLILSTPLTVCITVMGRHFPQWRFMNVLLSDEPPLPPATLVYQRLLVRDHEQVAEAIDSFLSNHSLEELCDSVLFPAMQLIETDRYLGNMDLDTKRDLQNDLYEVLKELNEEHEIGSLESESEAKPTKPDAVRILCIPARSESDELASELLALILRLRGHSVELLSKKTLAAEAATIIQTENFDLVIISAIPPAATLHIRYLCKRLRMSNPKTAILIGYWTHDQSLDKVRKQTEERGANKFVINVKDALSWIQTEAPRWASTRALQQQPETQSKSA